LPDGRSNEDEANLIGTGGNGGHGGKPLIDTNKH
jgi:hypothetical protein